MNVLLKKILLLFTFFKNNYRVVLFILHNYSFYYNFQYIVIFDIDKSNNVLPIIEDIEGKIDHYGFFRNADPENPILLCKDYELLTTYGMDKIGLVFNNQLIIKLRMKY